jgi:uncharacterized Zn-finger protein
MGLKHVLNNSWFTRLVLLSSIVSGVVIFVIFKNMEYIVHGQLYYYGLVFSPDWADPYRIYTWLIYVSLGLPMVLSGIALASSFLNAEKVTSERNAATQKPILQPIVAEGQSQQIELGRTEVNNSNVEIVCPQCGKAFGKALVMLDFHEGKNRLVSICPYCSHALGQTNDAK